MRYLFNYLFKVIFLTILPWQSCSAQKARVQPKDSTEYYSISPVILDKSVQANRSLMKAFFLCDCLIKASPTKSKEDNSLSLYHELLSNYSFSSISFLLDYTRLYADSVRNSPSRSKFVFASCMGRYKSYTLDKLVISLDSGLYTNKNKKN